MAICVQILNAVRTSKMFNPCRRFWMVHWGPFMLLVDSNTKNVRIRPQECQGNNIHILYIICMVGGFVSDVRTFCDGSPNAFGVNKQCDEWTLQTCSSYVKKNMKPKLGTFQSPMGSIHLVSISQQLFPAMIVVLFGDDICLHVCKISLHIDVTPIMKLHLPQSCYLQVLTEYHKENHSAMISIGCGGWVNCVDS